MTEEFCIDLSWVDREYVLDAPPKVVLPDAFTIVRDGEVVGKVSAAYDFSDLPPKYHGLVIQMIMPPRRIVLPTRRNPAGTKMGRLSVADGNGKLSMADGAGGLSVKEDENGREETGRDRRKMRTRFKRAVATLMSLRRGWIPPWMRRDI